MQVPAPVRWASRNLRNWMVRAVGIEPTLLAEPDFESVIVFAKYMIYII